MPFWNVSLSPWPEAAANRLRMPLYRNLFSIYYIGVFFERTEIEGKIKGRGGRGRGPSLTSAGRDNLF